MPLQEENYEHQNNFRFDLRPRRRAGLKVQHRHRPPLGNPRRQDILRRHRRYAAADFRLRRPNGHSAQDRGMQRGIVRRTVRKIFRRVRRAHSLQHLLKGFGHPPQRNRGGKALRRESQSRRQFSPLHGAGAARFKGVRPRRRRKDARRDCICGRGAPPEGKHLLRARLARISAQGRQMLARRADGSKSFKTPPHDRDERGAAIRLQKIYGRAYALP